MADLEKLVDDLSNLTVLEAADLAKMLEDKWGVSAAAAPMAMPMPQDFKISQSTAPFLWWPKTERTEVTTMVASEVARQICISCGL